MKRISHFRFSRSQRSGIFFLGTCVVGLQLLIWNGVFSSEDGAVTTTDPLGEQLEAYIDSLNAAEGQQDYSVKPFNPNYMSDHKGYMFGMTPEEIDKLFAFREAGGFIHNAKEFQKVTGVHDTVLVKMAPSFIFPRFPGYGKRKAIPVVKEDINQASASALQKIYGIGPVLAERIINYRDRLGGFRVPGQLAEVYGLEETVQAELWRYFHLDNPANYLLLNINMAGLEELNKVPYISKGLAAKIIAYRSVHQRFESLQELTKIHNLTEKDLTRIQLYLKVE